VGVSHFDVSWESFGDKSVEAIVLAQTDEVVFTTYITYFLLTLITTIKISSSSALRKRLFHSFFILFADVHTYDTKVQEFYTIISKLNAIWKQIK
jgi:hypothetical protein